jgi:hypothetical protein
MKTRPPTEAARNGQSLEISACFATALDQPIDAISDRKEGESCTRYGAGGTMNAMIAALCILVLRQDRDA